MKYGNTSFIDHLKAIEKSNISKKNIGIKKEFPENIFDLGNKIIYGPPGIGKYSLMLKNISKYSPTCMKYERKMIIESNKKSFLIKISDIHYEVDMGILGCNAKIIWGTIYKNILDIIATKQNLIGIIVCKNFHSIHGELLENFYSYMQSIFYKNMKVVYILLTENVCFIPYNIINNANIVSCQRPTKREYMQCLKKKINTKLRDIKNIKNLIYNPEIVAFNKKKCDKIIQLFNDTADETFFMTLRESLYDLLIYNLNIEDCIWYILNYYIKHKKIKNMDGILTKLGEFLKLYNNNYRPIYHLEGFFLYLYKSL